MPKNKPTPSKFDDEVRTLLWRSFGNAVDSVTIHGNPMCWDTHPLAKSISALAEKIALETVNKHLPSCTGCIPKGRTGLTTHQIDSKEHSPIVSDLEELFGGGKGEGNG